MTWNVFYSEQSRNDLNSIFEYIAYSLQAPETAGKQIGRIMTSIRDLSEMPEIHKLYDDEPWKSKGLRYYPIDNYLVFYLPKRENHTVNIVRLMYGGRDIKRQLEETIE